MLVVYAGNQRLMACKELGYEEVPVRIEDNLPKALIDKRMLGDNINRGEFDISIIAEEFPDEVLFMEEVQEFTDVDMNISAMTITPDKVKLHYHKLTFQLREEINLFYDLLDGFEALNFY